MIQKQRRWVQSLSLLALHSSWGPELKWLCNPVLSCHSCALAYFACPLGIYVHYSAYHTFPLLAAGTVLLLGVLFGRLLCGWVCPFGFLQDLAYKIPFPKYELPKWTSSIKYFVLLFTIFLFPWFLGEATWLSFCRVCPASALQVTVPRLLGGGSFNIGTTIKLAFLGITVLMFLSTERAFCNVLCPMGALLAPLNKLSFWKVKPASGECLACQQCDKRCPTGTSPSTRIDLGIPPSRALDCVLCHECQPVCPQYGKEGDELKKRKRPRGDAPAPS